MPSPLPLDDALVLALDMGTSSSRTALFDSEGNRVPGTMAQKENALQTSADGGAELDPEVFLRTILGCLEETLARHSAGGKRLRARRIAAIGVSCFWHSLIGTDGEGAPLTPIITWADARCRPEAARLRDEMPEREYHARTGCMLRASFWPAKLRWLRRSLGKARFAKVARWKSPAEWIQTRLCGSPAACAFGMASGTGLLNPRTLGWEGDLLAACGIRAGQLGALSDAPSRLSAETAARFPALAGAEWFPGIGDGAAGNLGSGADGPGRAAINLGTSGAFRLLCAGREDAGAPFGLFCYRVDAERYVVGGAVSNAGNLRAWCRRELRLADTDKAIDTALAGRPEPRHGLTVLPFWSAERAPSWNEDAPGVIHGVCHHTTALDLLQAATEATFHRVALIADLSLGHVRSLQGTSGKTVKIIVSGGILKSLDGLQRLADVLGRPLWASSEPEASLRGAAVFALGKLGRPPRAPSEALGSARPRPAIARAYARDRERHLRLEKALEAANIFA